MTNSWRFIPARRTSLTLRLTSSAEGRFARRRLKRDEVRCLAGRLTHSRHSGGTGAPPGLTMKPCQELADDRKVYTKRDPDPSHEAKNGKRGTYGESGARCVAQKSTTLARREAPACRKARATGLRFSARHPL